MHGYLDDSAYVSEGLKVVDVNNDRSQRVVHEPTKALYKHSARRSEGGMRKGEQVG